MSELPSERLRRMQTSVEAGSTSALAEFWGEVAAQGAPIIEQTGEGVCDVTFLWRDEGTRGVDVIQDWGAEGIREYSMTRLGGTDVWYKTRVMPSDTRTSYQIAPDPLPAAFAGGVPFIPDPLNPQRFLVYADETGFQIHFSPLTLPDAPAQVWLDAELPAGTVTLHTPFEDGRRIWVYVPHRGIAPGSAGAPYSLLTMFDGRIAKDMVRLPKMLDVQIARGAIRPSLALMIDNPDRKELMCDAAFAEYVARRVVPWARATFPISDDPARAVISGASYGGLCAAYIGLHHADVFGAVLAQTGWFRWHPDDDAEHEWLARQYVAHPTLPLRFYLDVGTLEQARMLDGGPSQLVVNRHLRDVLRAKGYAVTYREYSGGHDYSSTQNPLFEALPLILE